MLFDLEGPQPHRLALTEWQEQLSVLTVLGVEPRASHVLGKHS